MSEEDKERLWKSAVRNLKDLCRRQARAINTLFDGQPRVYVYVFKKDRKKVGAMTQREILA